MGNSIYGIGVSALAAAQAQLQTTEHNISNATTPGYRRQVVDQSTQTPSNTGVGFIGQGTKVDTVRRLYDNFLEHQVLDAQAESSQLDSYYSLIKQIDNVLADPSAGLSPALQGFFSSVQDVATNPASVASRQALLSNAGALTSRFQSLDQRFSELRQGVNSLISGGVTAINGLAKEIAKLNNEIIAATNSAAGQPPNDLLDQRDQLVSDLNKEIKTTVIKQDDGSYNVFIGNGQSLVVGSQAFALTTVPSPTNAAETAVGYILPTGGVALLPNGSLDGGNLGGALQFREQTLDPGQNALGRVAIALADTVNQQHQLGQDLNGNLGGNFFNLPGVQINGSNNNSGTANINATFSNVSALTASDYQLKFNGANFTLTRLSDNTTTTFASFPQTVDGVTYSLTSGSFSSGDSFLIQPTINGARDISVAVKRTSEIAAAAPIRTSTSNANTGTAQINAGSVNTPPPPNVNLRQPVTITFTGAGTFDVTGVGTGNPTGVAYTSGGNISLNGWTVQITGTPRAGDVFTIGPNLNGVADNRNVLLLGGLQTQNILSGGTTTYQGAYAQLVSDIGHKTSELEVTSTAQSTFLSQATQAQQSASGVNLDEEAANLIRFQQAFQAAGKMIQIGTTLFDTVLNLGK